MKNSLSHSKLLYLSIITICIFGFLLRLYQLNHQSLWNDELESWRISHFPTLSQVMTHGCIPDVHPPGYQMVLYWIQKYLDDSEIYLRLPSVIFGTGSILIIFLIGYHFFSYHEGMMTAIWMTILWCPLYYSQEARSYAMLLFFSLLSAYFWLCLTIKNNNTPQSLLCFIFAYILSAIINCYTHYFGLYFILLQGVAFFLLVPNKKVFWRGLLIYSIIFLAYIPWFPFLIEDLTIQEFWIPKPQDNFFHNYLHFIFTDSQWLLKTIEILYVYLFGKLLYQFLKEKQYRQLRSRIQSPDILCGLWLIVPFLGAYLKSTSSASVLTPRNLIISLPAAYLILANSLMRLPFRKILIWLIFFSLTLFMTYEVFITKQFYSKIHKQQYREAVQFIVQQEAYYPNALLVSFVWYKEHVEYYLNHFNSQLKIKLIAGKKQDIPLLLRKIQKKKPHYIFYFAAHRMPDTDFKNFIKDNFELIEFKEYCGAIVYILKPKPKITTVV